MRVAGAHLIDVGGESTRPGADAVDPVTEMERVLPVIEALAAEGPVSVDTRNAEVADAAVEAGATIINDVSASLWEVAAAADVPWVCMHMQGDPTTMQVAPAYDDVVAEVVDFLAERAGRALDAGVPEVWIDPGIGFGKTSAHNLELLAHLDLVVALGHPVVIGTSRKGFLGRLHARSDSGHRGPLDVATPELDAFDPVGSDDRIEATIATNVWAAALGASWVRVHDVEPLADAITVAGHAA